MIDDFLHIFTKEGSQYKKLVFDKDRQEKAELHRPMDINKGALHNVLEWHRMLACDLAKRMSLRDATGFLTQLWAEFWGIALPEEADDTSLRAWLLATALGLSPTPMVLASLLPSASLHAPESIAPYLDHTYLGISARPSFAFGSMPTLLHDVVYAVFTSIHLGQVEAALRAKAAGAGILIGR